MTDMQVFHCQVNSLSSLPQVYQFYQFFHFNPFPVKLSYLNLHPPVGGGGALEVVSCYSDPQLGLAVS